MGFLPDINEKGEVVEKKEPQVYTPPRDGKRSVSTYHDDMIKNDRAGTHLKDAPTMNNMHECVPDTDSLCVTCFRFMLI